MRKDKSNKTMTTEIDKNWVQRKSFYRLIMTNGYSYERIMMKKANVISNF